MTASAAVVPRLCGLILTVPAVLFISGCGSSDQPDVVPVSGVVHEAGSPVADATVTFMPSTGRPSTGRTDSEGRFTLRYTTSVDGAMVGTHQVTIAKGGSMPGPPPGASAESSRGGTTPPAGPAPPTEYKWPEPVTVTADSEEFDFDLVATSS